MMFETYKSKDSSPPSNQLIERRLKLANYEKRYGDISLWDQGDSRLDLSLFNANLPTLILNNDQKILDWNPAFDLIFGKESALARGCSIARWYGLLDNYRRVNLQTNEAYQNGVAPLEDRERATYLSADYGRMVFTRLIMPVVDHNSGKTIGWTVVLNINSVGNRRPFLDALFARIAREGEYIRHAANYDRQRYSSLSQKRNLRTVLDELEPHQRIIEFGAGTGYLTYQLLKAGHQVTAVDHRTHLLRRLRTKCRDLSRKLRIVRQNIERLRGLPLEKFQGALVTDLLTLLVSDQVATVKIFESLRPGGWIRAFVSPTEDHELPNPQNANPLVAQVQETLVAAGFVDLEVCSNLKINGDSGVITARRP